MTRSSIAAVSQVVQPRLLAPVTTNDLTGWPFRSAELLNGVHRGHGTLDHRLQQRPVGVARFEVVHEGLGDQIILDLSLKQGLVRHLGQHRDPGAAELRQGGPKQMVGRLRLSARAAAADEQEHDVRVGDLGRLVDLKAVRPGNASPGLRLQRDAVARAGIGRVVRFQLPVERGVRRLDIARQIGLGQLGPGLFGPGRPGPGSAPGCTGSPGRERLVACARWCPHFRREVTYGKGSIQVESAPG